VDYNGKNALFLLIKSLSFSEKKHFRQFANKLGANEEPLYISLFDLLQKQEAYKPYCLMTCLIHNQKYYEAGPIEFLCDKFLVVF